MGTHHLHLHALDPSSVERDRDLWDANGSAGAVLDGAHRVIRSADNRMHRVAREEGWPLPFSSVRFLVLYHLTKATAFGLTPRRLARHLRLRPSALAYHLKVLENGGLIRRRPRRLGDYRMVSVLLTDEGTYAARRLETALSPPRPR